jgi:DNA-binding NarL/FixJ family response regulator
MEPPSAQGFIHKSRQLEIPECHRRKPTGRTMKKISVLIVEDHTLVREGLRMILGLESDIIVTGEAKNGREAMALAVNLCPDIILMDIAMPGLNGLEAARQLARIQPTSKIIILSAHCDDAYVQSAVASGASGFLLKQDSTKDVCQAIREVHRGGIHYSSPIAKRFIRLNPKESDRTGKTSRKPSLLTSREMEVLQLIAEGKANKETAAALGISVKTVEKHRGQLMAKLDIHDTAGLTRHAISTGIIESSVQITIL